MYFYFPKQFRRFAARSAILSSVIVGLIGFAGVALAVTPVKTSSAAQVNLVITADKGSEWRLEVRQMPLIKVLDAIGRQTKVPIHHSLLPEGLVTAACVGTTLKPVLECLLDRKADLIVRYSLSSGKIDNKGQVAEVWILGSRLEKSLNDQAECVLATEKAESMTPKQNRQKGDVEPDQTGDLLKKAKSTDAAEREEAIGALLSSGHQGDPKVKAALEQALSDPDANVRAQAISTLAHREGVGAAEAIQDALHDGSVDVRMMAVDGITDDVALLQQAVNDSDETVRSLAALKLEELTQRNQGGP